MKIRSPAIITVLFLFFSVFGVANAGTLANVPLTMNSSIPPNVIFSLSVEYPTAVTAAYRAEPEYTSKSSYLGYFDNKKCYTYIVAKERFEPTSITTDHKCPSGKWSGNFMNWASMTGLDEFRHAVTGGNRYVDTATETVLERSFIDSQSNISQYQQTKFINEPGATGLADGGYLISNDRMGLVMRVISPSDYVTCTNGKLQSGRYTCDLTLESTGQSLTCADWSRNLRSLCAEFSNPPFPAGSFYAPSETNSMLTEPATVTADCTNPIYNNGKYSCDLGEAFPCAQWSGDGSSGAPFYCSDFSIYTTDYGPHKYLLKSQQNTKTFTANVSGVPTTLYYSSQQTVERNYIYEYVTKYAVGSAATASDYYVRVKVCDKTAGLESNCTPYGSSYKPTGAMQSSSEKAKFGVFSYYVSTDIDDAVMRSKAKFVSPKKYSKGLGTVDNANAEWSTVDGTFIADPDPDERKNSYLAAGTPENSGAINYINKFGRPKDNDLPTTYPVTTVNYKKTDDLSKLYYETLKYLRGGQPTDHFYKDAKPSGLDNFPIIVQWDDPIEYTCQKNYIITLADQFTQCDRRLPGGAFSPGSGCGGVDNGGFSETGVNPLVNVSDETDKVGVIRGGGHPNKLSGSTGSNSWYIVGLAHWAAVTDIRFDDPLKPNTLGKQHVKTYVIDVEENGALGHASQLGFAALYGGADSYDAKTGAPIGATVKQKVNGSIFDWPKALLRATDPEKMIASVNSVLSNIVSQSATESALAQSSDNLDSPYGAYIYRSAYYTGNWTGDVSAYHVDNKGVVSTVPAWQASVMLPKHDKRRIITFNDGYDAEGKWETSTNARKGVEFSAADNTEFATRLSSRQRAALNKNDIGTVDNYGVQRLNYLRGDQSNEGVGLGFRQRSSLLGDVVHSSPLYVGPPTVGIVGAGYNAFAKSMMSRTPMVYVGGNDGMLHGYDASTKSDGTATTTSGTELLAYVPPAVYPRLNRLTSPAYSHTYFVDGSPVAGEACFKNCTSTDPSNPPEWKTMLVGGLGAGGQGIYALDITDPSKFASTDPDKIVLWEFNDLVNHDLGYTFGKPLIRKTNYDGKWAVIFGNGFNNTDADGTSSSTGRAFLYIAFVTGPTGIDRTWGRDTDYVSYELKAKSEGAIPLSPANGLASVSAIDADANGTIDYIYAGDRYGNVWKFNMTSSDPTEWAPAFEDPGFDTQTPATHPFFSAVTDTNPAVTQQITTSIEVSRHPNGGFMLLFGTGSYIDVTDPIGPYKTQTEYGLWDRNDTAKTRIADRSVLQKQKILSTLTEGDTPFYFMSDCKPNYTVATIAAGNVTTTCPGDIGTEKDLAPQSGWTFDFPGDGERNVSEKPLLQGDVLTLTTLTPMDDGCNGSSIGKEYNLDYLTGGTPRSPIFDFDGDGMINSTDYREITVTDAKGGTSKVSAVPNGRKLTTGQSETPARFVRPKHPVDAEATSNCTDFVPGWGCLSKLGPPAGCKVWVQDIVSQQILDSLGSGNLSSAPMKCLNAPSGRISWRQLLQ